MNTRERETQLLDPQLLRTDAGRAAVAWLWVEGVATKRIANAFDYEHEPTAIANISQAIAKLREAYGEEETYPTKMRDDNERAIVARDPKGRKVRTQKRIEVYRCIKRYIAKRKLREG